MARRRRRYKETSLSSAIVILNILIVLVMGFLVFFVYKYITTEQDITMRTLPETQPLLEAFFTDDQLIEADAETTTELSITKASTTNHDVDAISDDAEPAFADMGYDKSFFSNDFFIGDSIMTGFSGFGYLPNDIVFAKIGLNPESVLTEIINGGTAVEHAEMLEPKRIYIMLGTNGLSYMSGDYMAKQMGKLLSELKNVCENSTIVLMTIPPVTEVHEENKPEENIDKINLYNDLLKSLARENDCMISDINTLLADDNGYLQSKYAEQDGLHFKDTAYKAVLSKLQNDLSLQ